MRLPNHWHQFIALFHKKFDSALVFDSIRIFEDSLAVNERYNTHEFDIYLPHYLPIADDSGGQVAVISKDEADTKVYLTSYGTLEEGDFQVLDRDLIHWMQRKFPFEQAHKIKQLQQTEEQQIHYDFVAQQLHQKSSLYPSIFHFWDDTYSIPTIGLPENYPTLTTLLAFQEGYAFSRNLTESLCGTQEGDFNSNWLVIATNYFADPFFIDWREAEENFPVYFAFHGAGTWRPIRIAASISAFKQTLRTLFDARFDQQELALLVEQRETSTNEFWMEVYQNVVSNIENEKNLESEIPTDDTHWREAALYITALGPNKMKVIALLKEHYNLSGAAALQLSKSDRILYKEGWFKWIQQEYDHVVQLGATAEIVLR